MQPASNTIMAPSRAKPCRGNAKRLPGCWGFSSTARCATLFSFALNCQSPLAPKHIQRYTFTQLHERYTMVRAAELYSRMLAGKSQSSSYR